MLEVSSNQHHLLVAQVILCGAGHDGKCCTIIDDELVGDVLYDNWQGFCHPISVDT